MRHRTAGRISRALLALAALWLAAGVAASAAEDESMPAWSGVLRRGTAEARVEALCDHSAGTHAIEVRMRGLTPGEVYSFWLVTHDGARGLGPPPHQLRALADGTLRLEATLDTCPLTFELHLRVYAHPAAGGRQLVVDGYVAER